MAENLVSILIIDDDPNIRKTLGSILKLKGFNIEEAGNASEGLSLAKSKFFNIAIVDIRLPDASGLDVLKAIRENNEDTVVIISTAYASLDSSIDAVNRGAYSYITKPVDMDQALVIFNRALEKQWLAMENKRLLRELQAANDKLKEMDKRKSAFVANVSHEFKSPLAIIRESLALVLDGLAGEVSPKQKHLLENSKKTVDRLNRLVMDLLDISKIEAGKMVMNWEEVDLTALVNEITGIYETEISKKEMKLQKNFPEQALLFRTDRDRLSEVIINLLSNAIKYTPCAGEITVSLSGSDQEVRFEISDSGPGIPEDDFEKIFDKFERITTEKQEGTGLGLPIAKDIVGLMNGKIWVESQSGKGSKFIFSLPKISSG